MFFALHLLFLAYSVLADGPQLTSNPPIIFSTNATSPKNATTNTTAMHSPVATPAAPLSNGAFSRSYFDSIANSNVTKIAGTLI